MRRLILCLYLLFLPSASQAEETEGAEAGVFPPARVAQIPRTRWDHRAESALWTRSALSALKQHGAALVETVPRDIADWCPAYPTASAEKRRAFWVGFLSALARYESTHRPHAVGGGGRWFGLLQILPGTARGYGCRARSGQALLDGPSNLSCAIRIMTRTVRRDGVVSRGMRGVAADWGPLVSRAKRHEMMAWTKSQKYCTPLSSVRPRARPEGWNPSRDLVAMRPKVRPPEVVEAALPAILELESIVPENGTTPAPGDLELEVGMPADSATAAPDDLELEVVTPADSATAATDDLELEVVMPADSATAAPEDLELEIVTPADSATAATDNLELEIVMPKANATAAPEDLELEILPPDAPELEIVSP